ncbi:MAG: hypothetical protein ACJA08_000813 [Cyclobacteriaceae bacterium]|jgi:hypothetical protein
MTQEAKRLLEQKTGKKDWRKWGPYLTERQWGTVREDYSPHGKAWEHVTHDTARSKAYRWGEEGIAGISDEKQHLCFSLALWNKKDAILKERLFGLSGPEGNHAEDVKEYYYYLDSTPTHSYMKMLYKYPQVAFPYAQLVHENRIRDRNQPEYELIDTGIFDEDKYFDVFVEYAKGDEDDLLIQITVHNRAKSGKAALHVLPQIWFRNTWSLGYENHKPELRSTKKNVVDIKHDEMSAMSLYCEGKPNLMFCENETNTKKLYGDENASQGYYKDGINDFFIHKDAGAVNAASGTKAAANYDLVISAQQSAVIKLRLTSKDLKAPFLDFDAIFKTRLDEADEFYEEKQRGMESADEKDIQRQAWAGMLWSKQFYYFDIPKWLEGDPSQPKPPEERKKGRNSDWTHLNNAEVISMPDKWEYPWYAAWDLAFHCIPLAMVDSDFAKEQLTLLTREWYMHPNGQLPAYEWHFGDVNPPVHAWATWRIFKMDEKQHGKGDLVFLEGAFHKLMLNFTWWVNRKDIGGNNIFQGGFLGLDNIGVFDRSAELPTGGHIEQADGTSWMAMFSLNLMRISLELAKHNPVYQNLATKFFEHFLHIAGAMANVHGSGIGLWDDDDEFFYDVLHANDDTIKLKVRSMVGLIPLYAVEVIEPEMLEKLPEFAKRLRWFLDNQPKLSGLVSRWQESGKGDRHLLSLLRGSRMKKILKRMLDETEFLSEYGIRALSKYHEDHPYRLDTGGNVFSVNYIPAESDSAMFGGNSNWRGPIWFPVNFLIIESLQKFHHYYGDDFKVEHPTGSGNFLTLDQIASELGQRLVKIFLKDEKGNRAVFGDQKKFQTDPHFKNYILFYEYFHGDSGRGVGASHQTGWTGLVAKLLEPRYKNTGPAAVKEGKKTTVKDKNKAKK